MQVDANTTTGAKGKFEVGILSGEGYSFTPIKEGYTFNPASAAAQNVIDNVTLPAFIASKTTVDISGTVTGANGVKVAISGNGISDSKDLVNAGDGYSFTVPVDGDYTLTVTKGSYVISPTDGVVTLTIAQSDVVQDFSAAKKQKTIIISGSVEGADNVTVTLERVGDNYIRTVTLDSGGSYSWEDKAGNDFILSAEAAGGEPFKVSFETYTNLQSDAGIGPTLSCSKLTLPL
ncbi:hypothetical protein ES708_17488 [subsurface metagenome]